MNNQFMKAMGSVLLSSVFFLLTIAAIPQPKEFLPVRAPSIEPPTTGLISTRTSHFTRTVSTAAPQDVMASSQPTMWRDTCTPHRMVVTGIGLQENLPTPVTQKTLSLTEPAAVAWLLAQVAGRYGTGHQPPDSVTFSTDAPQSIILNEPTSHTPAQGYTFETRLTPANEVSAAIQHAGDSYKTPRGLILYTKRQTSHEQWTSIGQTTNAFVWSGSEAISHSEVFTLGPRSGPVDLYITAVVIDNNDDDRPLVLEATAGDRTIQVAENGPTHGNLLNITPLTLTQVSSATTQVTVTLRSPVEENGDSLVLVGVNVSYRCSDNPDGGPPAGADLEVIKTVDNPKPKEGDVVVFTITVTNHGPNAATSVEISDTLPLSLTFAGYAATQGIYTGSTWTVGRLDQNASATMTLSAAVKSGTTGQIITNIAGTFAVQQLDENMDNNADSAVVNVISGEPSFIYLPLIYRFSSPPCYTETFNDPNSQWRFDSLPGPPTLLEYLNGRYHMFTQDTSVSHWTRSRLGPVNNYSVQVDVKWANSTYVGEGHGIVLNIVGQSPNVTYYRFNINNTEKKGGYVLDKIQGNSRIRLLSEMSPDIITGTFTNTLKVVHTGNSIEIFINEKYQNSFSDVSGLLSQAGYMGVDIVPYDHINGEALFDNFIICSYELNQELIGALGDLQTSGVSVK